MPTYPTTPGVLYAGQAWPAAMTFPEAARLLRVTSYDVESAAHRGQLPTLEDGGRLLIDTMRLIARLQGVALTEVTRGRVAPDPGSLRACH